MDLCQPIRRVDAVLETPRICRCWTGEAIGSKRGAPSYVALSAYDQIPQNLLRKAAEGG